MIVLPHFLLDFGGKEDFDIFCVTCPTWELCSQYAAIRIKVNNSWGTHIHCVWSIVAAYGPHIHLLLLSSEYVPLTYARLKPGKGRLY